MKELQRDPVSGALLHADLFAVDVDKPIEVKVPVRIVGTPIGVTFGGGILDFPLREIEVLCLPRAIPEELADRRGRRSRSATRSTCATSRCPRASSCVSDPDLSVVSVVLPVEGRGGSAGRGGRGRGRGGAVPAEGAAPAAEGRGAREGVALDRA